MALLTLTPQTFPSAAVTVLPAIDLYQYAFNQLPLVYQQASNFTSVLRVISNSKQYIYDIIRSLVNSYNLNNVGQTFFTLPNGFLIPVNIQPNGIYAQIVASLFNALYSTGATDEEILTSTQLTTVFVNSRGRPSDWYAYFLLAHLDTYFTNYNVEEAGNATLFFSLPIPNSPSATAPNPFDQFIQNANKLKGAGIEILLNPQNIPFFQYGSLSGEVAPGNAGFGMLIGNNVYNGGFYQSLS